jgi:5-methylcytosine-specific restriction protein A
MTTPGLPIPARPCRVCATPTTLAGGRCETHTVERSSKHRKDRAYYHTPEWARLRANVLRRDYYQCVVCTGTNRLTAHHITARKDGGADTEANLVTLCQSCHSRLESGCRETVGLLAEYLRHRPHPRS